jgi:glycerophosphoryl diester phosphodiesterase
VFDLQGHRGARGLFPENTLEGFARAVELGLSSFEIDIGVSRDGVPVLHHDARLNPDLTRAPDGRWLEQPGPLLRELTVAELQRYDVGRIKPGTFYAAAFASQAPHDGARIPTLAEVLRIGPALRFNIELKLLPDRPEWTLPPEEMTERVLGVVDAAGAADRVTIQSFDWRAPLHVRRIRPELATGWLTRAETVQNSRLWHGPAAVAGMAEVPAAIAAVGGGTWTPYDSELTPELLERAHQLGLKVIPWTVNGVEDMRRLIEWGVDGLITDWPDRALLLGARRFS